MKILYISDRRDGGILRHVKCLRECLPPEVETYEIGRGGNEEFAGLNGHDLREFWQIRRAIKAFKPDIVHFHIPAMLMVIYVRIFTNIPFVRSWHTPAVGHESIKQKLVRHLFGQGCYYLPVSGATWRGLKHWAPDMKGEVFFNPIRIERRKTQTTQNGFKCDHAIVGMVGRNADQKDWPSFHEVEAVVTGEMHNVEFVNGGEKCPCNGREEIGRMDIFVMTSKHEELPTTLLECFMMKTATCGFIPIGGVSDILDFSSGPLKEVFIQERDTARLSNIVLALLNDDMKRNAVIEDGWQILTRHFDAEKNCKGQLMDIYKRLVK